MNVTAQILTATNEGSKTITEMLKHTNERISVTSHQNQELTVLSSYYIAKIVIYGSYLRRMRINFRHRKLELDLLAQMIDSTILDDLEETSAVMKRAYSHAIGVFRLEFSARRRAPNVSVYRVDAFRYWSNLTHTPTLLDDMLLCQVLDTRACRLQFASHWWFHIHQRHLDVTLADFIDHCSIGALHDSFVAAR